ncbi:CHAT domain-containing protein [Pseudanabaena sp. FACHB-2040]|uniref:CHAT domain-containing tetratricopeptide repeat protein n=1 Tax=Pseudanabaena sp. FACHB-2040 TaxID=2692859 RepID=UPI001688442B|nr:CHAT domain-containing protein [Pseudanabaena sp. FACHB-2040]MBD2259304.1 CHAT domain-containing protein [Pseudanabaena sp. FACHB-2040]
MSTESAYQRQAALEVAIAAAERKRSQGDLLGAYADYQAIAAERLGGDYTAADLTILQSLADLAVLCGDFQPADDVLVSLVALCRQAKNLHRADFATLKRIHLALDRGQLRQATVLFEEMAARIGSIEAIDITPQGLLTWERKCRWPNTDMADRTVLFTLLYLEMGRLLSALGQYRDALEMLNRGLTHATPGDSQTIPVLARSQVPWLQLAIAQACLESGLLPEAEAVLTVLQPLLGAQQERILQIQWHTLAGKLALLRGVFGDALDHFQKILTLCHQLKIQRGVVIASLNLAQVLIVLNQNQLAQEHLISIADDIEHSQDTHLKARLALLQRLAQARSQSLVAGSTFSVSDLLQAGPPDSEPTQADASSLQDEESFTFDRSQSPNYLTFFEDRVLEFQWYLSQSDLGGATTLLAHIQAVFVSTDSQLILAKIKALQGMLSYYRGLQQIHAGDQREGEQQIRWAAVTLEEMRSHLARMGLKPEQWQAQRILGWCLMQLHHPTEDQEKMAAATTQLLEQMTQSLSPEQQVIFLLNKWTADEEYIATQIVHLQQLVQQLQTAPLHQRPRLGWQLLQRLNGLISHIDSYRGILVKRTLQGSNSEASPVPTPSLWRRLLEQPWRRATLSFLVLPDQVFVVRNWRFWIDFSVVPLTRLELRNLIQQWYKPLQPQSTRRGLSLEPEPEDEEALQTLPTSETIAQTLTEKLNLPALLRLPNYIRRLTIVPDDVLHIFPFAVVRHQNRYLIETYALSIAYESLKTENPPSPPLPKQQTLLVGVSQGSKHFAALPGVSSEIKSIYTCLTRQKIIPQVLMDADVSKESLLATLESTSFLHIACHGVFHHNQADQSGLVLDPQVIPPGVLSLREISQLNLTRLRHITLSACSSADHLVLPGRWVISLPEALWRSGTHSILGNLWEVYDQLAVAFMKQFYDYLQTLPRDEALRQTQLDCLHQRLPGTERMNTCDPKYWAGFTLYGQPQ